VSALSTCLGCGCACDDIQLHVEANRIVDARNACALGAQWFGDGRVPSRAVVDGRDVSVDDALTAAAAILNGASRALVYLAPNVSCEAQRASIAIADALHATIDSVTSSTVMHTVLAAQEAGRASATLGEIRNRADVVVFWGVDPVLGYPRFWTRYAPQPSGVHVGGRKDRTVIAVDVGSARGPEDADVRLTVMPDREVATLTELTAAVAVSDDRGASLVRLAPADLRSAPRSDVTNLLLRGKYIALIADAEPDGQNAARDDGRSAALIAFAQALNGPTRCALMMLRAGGNRSGADACLTAQTGYPMAVDFARGYPRYRPYDGAAVRHGRGGVDALLIVGSAALVPSALTGSPLIPTIVIGPRATEISVPPVVAIDTGVVGIHEHGTAVRMDEVPLPMAGVITGLPATVEMVAALARRLAPAGVARGAANRQ
jgi:formylmethanofuran dehydrogenase subunit B